MHFIMTRRRLVPRAFKAFGIGLAGAALAACQAETPPEQPAAELVFENARIWTVDEANPWAQAVAIRDGRFLVVGSNEDVARRTDSSTRVVDLGGKLVLPAFGDAHVHPVMGGLSYSRCSMHDGESVEEYLEIVAACVAETPGSGFVYGRGWRPGLFPPDGVPRKEALDAIAPDRPLVFRSTGGHSLWVNSKALEVAGITATTPDPPNGRIDRDPATGEPIGGLQEAAKDLMTAHLPPPSAGEMEGALLYAADHLNRLGVAHWLDAGVEVAPDGSSRTLDAYRSLHEKDRLTAHIALALKWDNGRGAGQLPVLVAAAERARELGFKAHSIKFYLDGVIAQRTAAMLAPYSDSADERGELQIPLDAFEQAAATLDARGFQVYVHTIGDRATRSALDTFAAMRERNGATGNRHMIAHLNVIHPEDQPRFAKLDVVANFQPLWATINPYMEMTAVRLGAERMRSIYPANSLLESGARIAYGADWSVASANPLEGIETALTRREPDQPSGEALLAHEGVTLEQAIEAYTLNVAWVNRLEEETGSITAGKSADLVVLDRDIFTLPAHEISEAKVLLTLFRGDAVHDELPEL